MILDHIEYSVDCYDAKTKESFEAGESEKKGEERTKENDISGYYSVEIRYNSTSLNMHYILNSQKRPKFLTTLTIIK